MDRGRGATSKKYLVKKRTGGSQRLTHTVWNVGREYLKGGKRIRGERFYSVRGECVILKI
jgi:hypothetical protein